MCCVTGQESSPHTVAFHHTRVRGPVQPRPLNPLYTELAGADTAIDETTNANFGQLRRFDTGARGAASWKEKVLGRGQSVSRHVLANGQLCQCVRSSSSISTSAMTVGSSFQIVPDERDLFERLANEAVPPVTPHEKLASDLLFAGRTEHGRDDVAIILLETLENHPDARRKS